MAKVMKTPLLKEGEFTVKDTISLSFFSLTGKEAGTKGTSNKVWIAELNVCNKSGKAQIYSMWGPTGGHQTRDWRHYNSVVDAEKDWNKIIKSKKKKGYQEVDVAIRAHGSDAAKKIIKKVVFTGGDPAVKATPTSKLPPPTQRLVERLFGATNNFVVTMLKCPLGQLTNAQIDKGRDALNKAKLIVNKAKKDAAGKLTKRNQTSIQNLTNDFYTLIPHTLGTGARGQMTQLLLDDIVKIMGKEDDLDTLLDAKSVGAVLAADSAVDAQYKALNSDLDYIDPKDPLFNWINNLVIKTRANNHRYLGEIKVLNVWKINRHNSLDVFNRTANLIAKTSAGQVIPNSLKNLKVNTRTDISDKELYQKANILPLFHGSRTQNIIGIAKQGLLIRPSNAVITGAMYGPGVYNGLSSKSINYTNIKTSYWANGKDDKAFLFITDTILGNQKIAQRAYQYNKQNIKPYHSVWAKGGQSGVINDEWITYDVTQVLLRYLIEFTCIK